MAKIRSPLNDLNNASTLRIVDLAGARWQPRDRETFMTKLLRVVPALSPLEVAAAAPMITTPPATTMYSNPSRHAFAAINTARVGDGPAEVTHVHAHTHRNEISRRPAQAPSPRRPFVQSASYEPLPDQAVRRLRAIVCLDVAGYSRMMERDEIGTDARLERLLSEIVLPAVARHGGRVDHLAGDGALAHFASVVGALRCSTEIQQALRSENRPLSPDRRIQFRIGVNLGDVIVRGARIAGHGVNVAARLQALAKSGQVCVSEQVREEGRAHQEFEFVSMGYQRVKNIQRPIRAYTILLRDESVPQRRFRTLVSWPAFVHKQSIVVALLGVIAAAVQW